ncbi:MAG: ThiF family adenylyltransferase [Hyphomicrobiales bacterium]|nr:ThiF family adenylyltransferase [Hyphomicrobiales bacterium]
MPSPDRFDRNERLFGKEGQQALRRAHAGIVGVGGLGTHVVQQLALLGVGALTLIDDEELSRSNRNRYIGAWQDDPVPGSPKVDLGRRLAGLIDAAVAVTMVKDSLLSPAAFAALRACDYIFGCVDSDGARFVLNEFCLAYDKPLFDLASDAPEPGYYGGRLAVVWGDSGCLHCRGLLDEDEVRRFLSTNEILENEAAVYGIDRAALDEAGPSVVSVNGVVASLGVTEFMAAVSGIRPPHLHLDYRGDRGTVGARTDDRAPDCYYCGVVKGQGDTANIERYFVQRSPRQGSSR